MKIEWRGDVLAYIRRGMLWWKTEDLVLRVGGCWVYKRNSEYVGYRLNRKLEAARERDLRDGVPR